MTTPAKPIIVPYNPRNETFCPKCNSLHTMYMPAVMVGRCEDCGFRWRFLSIRQPPATRNGGIT